MISRPMPSTSISYSIETVTYLSHVPLAISLKVMSCRHLGRAHVFVRAPVQRIRKNCQCVAPAAEIGLLLRPDAEVLQSIWAWRT